MPCSDEIARKFNVIYSADNAVSVTASCTNDGRAYDGRALGTSLRNGQMMMCRDQMMMMMMMMLVICRDQMMMMMLMIFMCKDQMMMMIVCRGHLPSRNHVLRAKSHEETLHINIVQHGAGIDSDSDDYLRVQCKYMQFSTLVSCNKCHNAKKFMVSIRHILFSPSDAC